MDSCHHHQTVRGDRTIIFENIHVGNMNFTMLSFGKVPVFMNTKCIQKAFTTLCPSHSVAYFCTKRTMT